MVEVETLTTDNATWNSATQSLKTGMKMTANKANLFLKKVTKEGSCTATKAYLYSDNAGAIGNLLDTQDFTGNVAPFNYALVNATPYWVLLDKAGANYTNREGPKGNYGSDANITWSNSYVQWAGGIYDPTSKRVVWSVHTEEITGPDFTKASINVGDVFKSGAGMSINVNDVFKDVAGMSINVGDSWKTVF